MARSLCPDVPRVTLMVMAAFVVLLVPSAWGQVAVIGATGVVGLTRFAPHESASHDPLPISLGRRSGVLCLALFFALLIALPLMVPVLHNQTMAVIDAFYRAGSLVFGGGHVVLPLLQAEVVPPGWVGNEAFLAGYGAAQAVPGPLFTFAAFLGASMTEAPTGWLGGLVCLIALFAPSFLLVAGALPFWERLRAHARAQAALAGINAGVVGLLLAALYNPVWTSAIHRPQDFGLALLAFVALSFWKLPPWLVVACSGVAGVMLHALG